MLALRLGKVRRQILQRKILDEGQSVEGMSDGQAGLLGRVEPDLLAFQ
jgi:hypothetical protein